MTPTYIDIAQRALTPEEYISGITYKSKAPITAKVLSVYYKEWVSILGSEDACYRRLAWSGYTITDDDILREASSVHKPPRWLDCFREIITSIESSTIDCIDYSKQASYLMVVRFFLDYIKNNISPYLSPRVLDSFLLPIERILTNLLTPTLDYLFQHYQYENKYSICSDNMYPRFLTDFISNPLYYLKHYSYLCRLLATFTIQTIDHVQTFATRVRNHFNQEIVHTTPYQSDLHTGFQSSILFTLSGGQSYAYKPRSLKMEALFYKLVNEWVPNTFYSPKIIQGEGYGFMTYINHEEVSSEEDFLDYFYKAGQLLALITALDGFDFHHENIIAKGIYPVIIDLETLLHPHVFWEHEMTPYLRTGLVDTASSAFDGLMTHTMTYKKSLPCFKGRYVDRSSYQVAFQKGLDAMKNHMIESPLEGCPHYQEMLKANSRVIIRSTRIYENLLYRSLRPQYLQTGFHRSLCFELLFKEGLKEPSRPWWWHLLEKEKQSLVDANIPIFFKNDYYLSSMSDELYRQSSL